MLASFWASLPTVVVLPVPLTPTTRITVGFRAECERRRGPNSLLDLLGERVAEVGQLATRLQSPHDLRRCANAHITVDQGFLEPLPRLFVAGVERARGDLCSQGTTALRE